MGLQLHVLRPTVSGWQSEVARYQLRELLKIGYIGIIQNRMETTVVFWGNIGLMEKKIETTL